MRFLLGVLFNVTAGLVVAGDMVLNIVMTRDGRPYWSTTTVALFIASLVVAGYLVATRTPALAQNRLIWIALRGTLGGAYWILSIVAVQVGAPPGDVAALMSLSIVSAALLGRILLGEELRLLQHGAIAFSLAGALLISRPVFLFGGDGGSSSAHEQHEGGIVWLGHLLAVVAGVTQSCAYISSRKAADVAVGFHTLSSMMASTAFSCVIPFTPIAGREIPQMMLSFPLESTGWVAIAFALASVSVALASAGAMLCPAVVSVTSYTTASMLGGYAVQTLIFNRAPSWTTLLGAALMMAAVLLMAAAKAPSAGESTSEGSAAEKAPRAASKEGEEASSAAEEGHANWLEGMRSFKASSPGEQLHSEGSSTASPGGEGVAPSEDGSLDTSIEVIFEGV